MRVASGTLGKTGFRPDWVGPQSFDVEVFSNSKASAGVALALLVGSSVEAELTLFDPAGTKLATRSELLVRGRSNHLAKMIDDRLDAFMTP